MELKLDKTTLIAIGVIALALLFRGSSTTFSMPDWSKVIPSVGPVTPDVVIVEPTADVKTIVEKHGITNLVAQGKNPAEAATMGYFYTELGKRTVGNEAVTKSTSDVRAANVKCGQALFGGILKGKYPGLANAIDAAVIEAIGKQNAPLTPESRARAVKIFEAIGWACYQGGK